MKTTYSMVTYTKPTLESFAIYKVTVNSENSNFAETNLTPDEIATAKIIRYIYEKHGGWPKDFTLFDETMGNMGCPGIFSGLGGPKEVPSPNYMNIEEATERRNSLLNTGFYDENSLESPERTMNKFNHFEDQLIENIKRKKDTRRELLNKIMNKWNISSDGVIVHHGIDKFHENSLC